MPLVKLGYLLIRTIAKPVSGGIKNYAKNHPKFRKICISVAQGYHKLEVRLRRGLISKKKIASLDTGESVLIKKPEPEIKPLDPNMAIETGANFIGESIVFIVAGILLIADQINSKTKENARREAIEIRLRKIEENLYELEKKAENQKPRLALVKEEGR
jgi:optic atrophy 3 protein